MSVAASRRKLSVHTCELPKTSGSNLLKLPLRAKFYVRWKRRLQKLIIVSMRHPLTRIYLRSRSAVAFERRRHGRSTHWWVIHPFSDFRYGWDVLMMLTLFYVYALVPYIASFYRIARSTDPRSWHVLYPAYTICIVDVLFNFITGFVSPDGPEIFLDPLLILQHYATGYFIVDVASSVPYAWFHHYTIPPPGPDSEPTYLILELLPMIKIIRLRTLRRYIKQVSVSCGISRSPQMTIWLALLTMLIFHWSSCLINAFPYVVMHIVKDEMKNSESYLVQTELHKKPQWEIYLTCLHIGASNLIGSNFLEFDVFATLDKTIRCILLLLGKGYMIYLIVIILQLVESSGEPEIKYQEIMHQVHAYIRDKNLPSCLRDKLIAYYEYRYQGSFFKENVISSTLPGHLNQETLVHCSRGVLENASIFHNLSRSFLGSLIAVMKPVIYMNEDVIYESGSVGDCMYFIASGTVAVITASGKEVCHLQDGEYFGEPALTRSDRRRLETVLALEVCELLRFDRRDFRRLVAPDTELYDRLQKVANEMTSRIEELDKLHVESQQQNPSA